MLDLPIHAWLFILAVVAAVTGKLLVGKVGDDPGSFPGWILYAVAIGFAIIGLATMWMSKNV